MKATVSARMSTSFAFLACLLFLVGGVSGQETAGAATNQTTPDSADAPGTSIIPFPFVFYTPETKIGFGGTVITMFRLSESGTQAQPSSISPIFVYTQKKQLIAMLGTELYLGSGRYRVNAEVGYSRFPNTIWGIGNDTPDDLEEDYTPRVFNANVQFQRRVAPGWYLGGLIEFAHRRLIETDSLGLLEAGQLPGTEDGRILSGGLLITWDTRDNTVYPRNGGYRQLMASKNDSAFGSDYEYSRYSLDVRQYVSVSPGHVLALRGLGVATVGTQPFDVMPQLGGEELLRGYYGGRYRDRNLIALQAEYRAHVWKRFGAVGFVSTGRVSRDLSDMDFSGFKHTVGFGLRFLLAPDEGLNLRADWGFGNGSSGFYLGMGEVF
jgi:outer membrane protein assembly factor BamA